MINIDNQIINIDYIKYIEFKKDNNTLMILFTDDTYTRFTCFDEDDYDDLITELEEKEFI